MKKISIIVICYNAEKTLADALESACRQTYQNLDIVFVDDGSEDCSLEIAKVFAGKDQRVRVICHQKNKGVLSARKTGIRAAIGDLIMFLDSDDMLLPYACERAADAMEQTKADFVQFGTNIIKSGDISDAELSRKERNLNGPEFSIDCREENDRKAILNACYLEHRFSYTLWNKIYRAYLLKKAISFVEEENVNMGEDMYCLFLVTSMADKMAVIKDRLYIYHFGQGISCVSKTDPMQAFKRSCETMTAVQALKKYLYNKEAFHETIFEKTACREESNESISEESACRDEFHESIPKELACREESHKSVFKESACREEYHEIISQEPACREKSHESISEENVGGKGSRIDYRQISYVSLLRQEMLSRTLSRFYPMLSAIQKREAAGILRKWWPEEKMI